MISIYSDSHRNRIVLDDDDPLHPSRSLHIEMHPSMRAEVEKLAMRNDVALESFIAAVFWDAVTHSKVLSREVTQTANLYAPKLGRKAKAFICHATEDKTIAREIYDELAKRDVDPWLDEKNLFAGQNWDNAIQKVIGESDVILILLSQHSISKRGYVQKEIRKALEVADLMPEGRIYLIPIRLAQIDLPESLARWHAIDYGSEEFYLKLLRGIQTAIEES